MALETGGQMGASVAMAHLIGLPFANGRARLIAMSLGGGIPTLFKSGLRIFNDDDKYKTMAVAETLLNGSELAVSTAISFLPSARGMLIASVGAAMLFEAIRQRLWKKNWEASTFSVLCAGGITAALGIIPLKIAAHYSESVRRRMQPFHEDRERWERIQTYFTAEIGNEAERVRALRCLADARRQIAMPTKGWYWGQKETILTEGLRDVRKLLAFALELEERQKLDIHSNGQSAIFLDEIVERLSNRSTKEMGYALEIYEHYHGLSGHRWSGRRDYDAFGHELGNEFNAFLMRARLIARRLARGEVVPSDQIEKLQKVCRRAEVVFRFYQERAPLPRSIETIRERFALDKVVISHEVVKRCRLRRGKGFQVATIVEEFTRNAARVAERREIPEIRIRFRELGTKFQVIDNSGGIRSDGGDVEKGFGGLGMRLAQEIADRYGWKILYEPIDGGTIATIDFLPAIS